MLSTCPLVRPFVHQQTREHDILQTNKPILMPTGTSGPYGEGMKRSTLGVRRSTVNVKDEFGLKLSFKLVSYCTSYARKHETTYISFHRNICVCFDANLRRRPLTFSPKRLTSRSRVVQSWNLLLLSMTGLGMRDLDDDNTVEQIDLGVFLPPSAVCVEESRGINDGRIVTFPFPVCISCRKQTKTSTLLLALIRLQRIAFMEFVSMLCFNL